MKIKTEIDVKPSEYFRHLCNVMIKDIKKQTDKDITMKDLMDGYQYDRPITYKNRTGYIKIHIGPLIQDKYFFASYETNDTKGNYYYDFSSENGKNYLVYGEENDYKEVTVGNYFGNLSRKLKAKATERKALQNIELTQTYIKNHKDE